MEGYEIPIHPGPRSIGGFAGVCIAVILIFIIAPLLTDSYYGHLFLEICFTILLVSTIRMMGMKNFHLLLFVVVGAVPFLFLDALSILYDSIFLMILAYSFYCLFLFSAILVLSKRVLTIRMMDHNLIFGAITVYLLSGILWGKIYFILNTAFSPNGFHGIKAIDLHAHGLASGYAHQFDLLYYSFIILTGVGIGDITPWHKLMKSLTIMEAIFGQLFVASIIGKVVSVWHPKSVSHQRERERL